MSDFTRRHTIRTHTGQPVAIGRPQNADVAVRLASEGPPTPERFNLMLRAQQYTFAGFADAAGRGLVLDHDGRKIGKAQAGDAMLYGARFAAMQVGDVIAFD